MASFLQEEASALGPDGTSTVLIDGAHTEVSAKALMDGIGTIRLEGPLVLVISRSLNSFFQALSIPDTSVDIQFSGSDDEIRTGMLKDIKFERDLVNLVVLFSSVQNGSAACEIQKCDCYLVMKWLSPVRCYYLMSDELDKKEHVQCQQ
ncbi:hypothetical protein U9M48_037567 [Paspalum notatum var. saurae]|uniref:Uncharacterized protein n=1 Tax=Paspalum notatum var. saurae TaxID=547442 RepID=A0AAQ3UJK7_PASNO